MSRGPNGRGTVFRAPDGRGWIGEVSFGIDPKTKKRIRRRARRRTKAEAQAKVDEMVRLRDEGVVPSTSRLTVSQWLEEWIIYRTGDAAPNTLDGYRTDLGYVRRSGLGDIPLRQLRSSDIEEFYLWLVNNGDRYGTRNKGTVKHVRSTLSGAFGYAVEKKHLTANPVTGVKLRGAKTRKNRPYTPVEVFQLHEASREQRNGVRWDLGVLGLRRGESLGLQWSYVDLDHRIAYIEQAIHWRKWQHGCEDRLGGKPCGRQARYCPDKHSGGPAFGPLKNDSSHREIALPHAVVEHLRRHQEVQQREREAAGDTWQDWNLVVATPFGAPISWSVDGREWKAMRATAGGLRPIRTHDLRHTSATTLGRLGITGRDMTGWMGWSTSQMADTYVRVEHDSLLRIADSLDSVLTGTHEMAR